MAIRTLRNDVRRNETEVITVEVTEPGAGASLLFEVHCDRCAPWDADNGWLATVEHEAEAIEFADAHVHGVRTELQRH